MKNWYSVYKIYWKLQGNSEANNISTFYSHHEAKRSLNFPIVKQMIPCLHMLGKKLKIF
jgi:hypothetical protein